MAVALVLPMVVLAGCISWSEKDQKGEAVEDITVTIEFEGFDPDTFPDKVALWEVNGMGSWSLTTRDSGENDTIYTVTGLSTSTVLEALVAAGDAGGFPVEHHTESLGAFVDSIDGIIHGKGGHYWSYYINDEYGLVAADTADLSDGDVVRWVYMGNPFG